MMVEAEGKYDFREIGIVMTQVLDKIPDEATRRFAELYASGDGNTHYARMGELMAATGVTHMGVKAARTFCQTGLAGQLFLLTQRRRQLASGFDAEWKRGKLALIVEGNTENNPSASVSAIRELNAMDHSYDRVINAPELANAPLLDRQQQVAQLIGSGQMSIEEGAMMSKLIDSQINSGQLKVMNELVRRVQGGESAAEVAGDLLARLPREGTPELPSFM